MIHSATWRVGSAMVVEVEAEVTDSDSDSLAAVAAGVEEVAAPAPALATFAADDVVVAFVPDVHEPVEAAADKQ